MAFDNPTRNRLNTFVGRARQLITTEFTQKFQSLYGIALTGELTPLSELKHLDEAGLATAALLRARIDYLIRSQPVERDGAKVAVERLAREQAFTVLNRLAAVRMAEKRDLIVESVGHGFQSKGFQVFERVAGKDLGDTFQRYRRFLFCLFDELSVDLGVLFDRRSPQALLFPREPALLALFDLINAPDLDALWAEDETIGWIYQYYNDQAERKTMREQSAAPRNSRELAVRNQFFTPRYVVEFLTDNTLGRIWYEMTQGQTKLKEQCRYLVRRPTEIFLKPGESAPEQPKQDNLSQEELLKQPVHIPHRPLKDPRTILMLDPACGSMHFGLYAFDLFEVIYDEAWALEEKLGADALSRPPSMKSLHATYAGKAAFLKDVPRLIIEHNIHGIDIDPRASQIAGLALWLRAQKAWQRLGLKPAERPAIKRSNIVCAEPMPGEKELLREFVEREFPAAERAVCLRLLEAIFDKMQLAGEAGSLLKIEEEIRSAIEDARDAWQKLATKPPELFTTTELNQISTAPELTGLEQAVSSLTPDPRHLTTDFWERIEERIYAALRDYAEQAENGGGFQRRLFAEDAARGFAFIDVCRKRYDVALMNPPFGDSSEASKIYVEGHYKSTFVDMFAAFVERSFDFGSMGFTGAITPSIFLYAKTLENWRRQRILRSLNILIDMGFEVLDNSTVETCVYVLERTCSSKTAMVFDLRPARPSYQDALEKQLTHSSFSFASLESYLTLPRCRILHELSEGVTSLLNNLPAFEPNAGVAKNGLQTYGDERFIRLIWEVPPCQIGISNRFRVLSKGGDFETYYFPTHLLMNYWRDGMECGEVNKMDNGQDAQTRRNGQYFYRAGLTFPTRSTRGFSVRQHPKDAIFTIMGAGVIPAGDDPDYYYYLGWINSSLIRGLVQSQANTGTFVAGIVQKLPWKPPSPSQREATSARARGILEAKRSVYAIDDSDPYFAQPAWLFSATGSLKSVSEKLMVLVSEHQAEVLSLSHEVDRDILKIYGLSEEEVEAYGIEPEDHSLQIASLVTSGNYVANLILAAALGNAFGRWDIRYATGEQAAPELPDPFAPLPVCPPGQLQNAQGLPARPEDVPAAYPVRIPWDGILVDGPNHPLDIERRVREVIEIIWSGKEGGRGPTAEAIDHEACAILGVKSLRDYFRKPTGFFADHLKRYSKSRRQAPIYWPLSTASGSYTLWIYYHRLTDQTLHTVLADFLKPKIKSVEQEISGLRGQGKVGSQIGELQSFLDELLELHEEIERVIKLPWKPNLNDGVLITAAPLWKLFRFSKWQKDLKACWAELEAGDYDWAHLAYTIWPNRVREKCKADRSLAIAHGLEDICEVKAPEKKAKKSKTTKTQMEIEDAE